MRRLASLLAAALLTTGCLTTGMYRTARTLPEDEGDLTLSFSVVRTTVDAPEGSSGPGATFTYPNVVPEISYHLGVAPDVEIGGRLALGAGMIELDTKWRFVHEQGLHLAVQPAAGYRTLGFIEGFHGSLPLILTKDLSPRSSLNVSAFGSFTHFRSTEDFGTDDLDLRGDMVLLGAALGLELRSPRGFHFMPAVEFQRSVFRGGDVVDAPDVTAVIFGVSLGWGPDERARKMDEQLDRIERKLDRPAP